jgi:hypothetical protein
MRLKRYTYIDLGVLTLLVGVWLISALTLLIGIQIGMQSPILPADIQGAANIFEVIVTVLGMFVFPVMLLIGTTFGVAKLTESREARR